MASRCERTLDRRIGSAHQLGDPALCAREERGALLLEANALFEETERLFEGEIAPLQPADGGLEF
jgi:hypothetical protein